MLRLKTYLRFQPPQLQLGGICPDSLTISSSRRGTRTSVEAAMLILSVYERFRHGRNVFRSR